MSGGRQVMMHNRNELRPPHEFANIERINTIHTMNAFTAVVKNDGTWWYGWIEEVPGVNAQEATREELLVSLRECLSEVLEMNRQDAIALAEDNFSEEPIAL